MYELLLRSIARGHSHAVAGENPAHVTLDVVKSSLRGDFVTTYRVGYIVGSLSQKSINRTLSKALIRLAPSELEFVEIPIKDLPVYNHDYDADYPPEGRALKEALAAVDAILFVTPEYNRSIPGALKNAIDWASRPWGDNSFIHKPSAVIGTSPGKLGTAVAQQSLRSVLGYLNSPQMNAPEAYIQYQPDVFTEDGEVLDESTARFLRDFMEEFGAHVRLVLTVLPPQR
jgi:chromate reductase, NAD(P)H dehydrogenase (quinone)